MRKITRTGACASELSRSRGFSLAELILLVLIVSVLGVVIFARFDSEAFEEAAFYQELITAIRYAQKLAINSGCEIQVQVVAATGSFSVTRRSGGSATSCGAGTFGEPVPSPSKVGSYQGTAPTGVDVLSDLSVSFDSLGLPSGGGSVNVGGQTIIVEGASGYVH
jgi:MSHA pilin protein MshC